MRKEFDDIDLDALIEEALSAEPVRSAPIDFAARVDERLRVHALIERERARFRASMATLAVAVVAIIAGAGIFVGFTHLQSVMAYGAPGAKGALDYWANEFLRVAASYTGAYSLAFSLLLALAALGLVVVPWQLRRMRHH
jgi:hypothetical protein